MNLIPDHEDWRIASTIFDEFSCKPGAQHIASAFALAHLSCLLRICRPCSVLEIGAGIGTITKLLLTHPVRIPLTVGTEYNRYCLDQISRNIGSAYNGRFDLHTKPDEPLRGPAAFDLIVIDGQLEDRHYGRLTHGSICFIEGSRKSTRKAISHTLERRALRCEFVNYNRGVKYFRFSRRTNMQALRFLPRFKLRGVTKGCWIGKIGG